MRITPSKVVPGHPDYPDLKALHDGIADAAGGLDALSTGFPHAVRDAIDFVLDPVRTCRTQLADLDNVEKTFVGLKVEHYVRDLLNAPKGVRDLVIAGRDVDIKNTLRSTWMIPPETYRNEEPCLLILSSEADLKCWMGLFIARAPYLNRPNRDGKRSVQAQAFAHIFWLIEGASLPKSLWEGFDMLQFRTLRTGIKGGMARAVAFFTQYPNKAVNRHVLHMLLFDQADYMKRLRGNGGARDKLKTQGIALLSGRYDNSALIALGRPRLQPDEFIALVPGSAKERRRMIELELIAG